MMLAERLSEFALAKHEGLTQTEACHIMRLSLIDWAVCGLAGKDEPVSQILRNMLREEGGAQQSVVFGESQRFPMRAAALANGAISHALDYDDTHFDHIGHPSVVVCSAALATAGDATGAEVLEAALIGAELSVRVGSWLGRDHYQVGFHQTATAGAFGAAGTAGRLLGLSHGQMVAAFGLVATRAAGLKSQFGTMGKPYHAGLAASAGVEAAQLAKAGFDTRGQGLDGPQGFGPTHHGESNLSAFDGLGSKWRMAQVSHKFHACCHGLHAMLEALGTLRVLPKVSEIDSIQVQTHPRWLSVCDIAEPDSDLETKFSYRHTAAMALSGLNTASLKDFSVELARRADLRDLRARVVVRGHEGIPETACRVDLRLKDGQILTVGHDLSAPLEISERASKLRAKGSALLGESRSDVVWNAVFEGETPSVEALTAAMAS